MIKVFICMYENTVMKPIKCSKREESRIKIMKGVNLIKVYYMCVWKYHS
jgi:hypothetical protein